MSFHIVYIVYRISEHKPLEVDDHCEVSRSRPTRTRAFLFCPMPSCSVYFTLLFSLFNAIPFVSFIVFFNHLISETSLNSFLEGVS